MSVNLLKKIFRRGCRSEFQNLLSPYLDGELDALTRTRLETHLRECSECRAIFKEISFASDFVAKLELPEKAAAGFPHWLKTKKIDEKKPALKPAWRVPAFASVFALLVILTAGGGIWFYNRSLGGQQQQWAVTKLAGAPVVGTKTLWKNGALREGEWLETNESSRALLTVSNVGHVEVEENSRLQLIKARSGEQRLELKKGRINASIVAPPRLFFVKTPAATAIDYGCAYSLEVAESGESLLQVTEGWVKLEAVEGQSSGGVMIPAGASSRAIPGKGAGAPFFEDSAESFRQALRRFDFENGGSEALDPILAEARPRDSLTLWYVLKKADAGERERVFNRLAEFVPPPSQFSRDYILNHLDAPEIEESWREKIEYASVGIDPSKLPTTGELRLTGTMTTARFSHTATLMSDGRVLVAGGMEREEAALSSAEIYDPQKGEFQPTGQMTTKRIGHTATALRDGRVLITGGSDTTFFVGSTGSAEIYDPATHSFYPAGGMTVPRLAHRATLLADGRVLITGGQEPEGEKLASAEIFDPATNSFQSISPMSSPRSDHTATLLADGSVLIAGGAFGYKEYTETLLESAEIYDPKKNKFYLTGKMSIPRFKHSATLLADGKVLITGGADSRLARGKYQSAEIYDPATSKFTVTGSLKTARYKIRDSVVALPNHKVLVAGGGGRVEVFDPKSGYFNLVKGGFNTARYYATATLLPNGEVLIMGGYIGGGGGRRSMYADTSAWLYKP